MGRVFGVVGESADLGGGVEAVEAHLELVSAVEEGVAGGEVEGEAGRVLEGVLAAGLEGGDHEAEAGDGDGERVEVDAVHGIQRLLDPGARLQAGGVCAQRSLSRANAPRRKWPDPQVGSIIRNPSSGRSARAGSIVWSRMNSSTNSGVWSRAKVFFA